MNHRIEYHQLKVNDPFHVFDLYDSNHQYIVYHPHIDSHRILLLLELYVEIDKIIVTWNKRIKNYPHPFCYFEEIQLRLVCFHYVAQCSFNDNMFFEWLRYTIVDTYLYISSKCFNCHQQMRLKRRSN